MFTRSAIFRGHIHPGMEEAFYDAVREQLVPAWRQMLHAEAVRVFRPVEIEAANAGIFLVQEIDYPSRAAIAEALASPRRLIAMEALAAVRPLYQGAHTHVIYQRL